MKKIIVFILIAIFIVALCSCGEEPALYSVVFVNYDNSIITSQIVKEGDAATAPVAPRNRTGYTFSGWDKDFSNVTSDLTVKAQYKIITYTVTFVDDDGKIIKTQKVPYGSSATAPEPPIKEGLAFFGWDTSFDNVTEDITVTAIYDYALEFELNEDGQSYSVKAKNTKISGNVTIPATYNDLPVTSIGEQAFFECRRLESITIPTSVTSIRKWAFRNCTNLASITIPDSVTFISDGAFSGCGLLTSITIPDGVTSIGNAAFSNCTSLTSITIPDSVTYIGDSAFYCCVRLTSITIPDSVTYIGEQAFRYCTGLTNITIPDSVTTIERWAFQNCTNLKSITIPVGVTSIGSIPFSGCTSLTDITYAGTKAEWESIIKNAGWDDRTPHYTVHCTDGDIEK